MGCPPTFLPSVGGDGDGGDAAVLDGDDRGLVEGHVLLAEERGFDDGLGLGPGRAHHGQASGRIRRRRCARAPAPGADGDHDGRGPSSTVDQCCCARTGTVQYPKVSMVQVERRPLRTDPGQRRSCAAAAGTGGPLQRARPSPTGRRRSPWGPTATS
jgi:hypothetical protein